MAIPYPTDPTSLLAAIAASDDTARRLTADLPESRLHVAPLVSHGLSLDRMGPAIAAAPRSVTPRPWRPTLFGRLLLATVGPRARMKLPTARIFEPGPAPRPRVIAAFLTMQQETARLLREGANLDWRGVRLSSPVKRWIRLNLGDAYVILVIHAQRHLNQIARIRAAIT